MGPIGFHRMESQVNGVYQLFGYQHCSKNLFLCMFSIRKKLIQVWNNLRVSKL